MIDYVCNHCNEPITEGKVRTGLVDGQRIYLHDEWLVPCGGGAPCSTFYDKKLEGQLDVEFADLDKVK